MNYETYLQEAKTAVDNQNDVDFGYTMKLDFGSENVIHIDDTGYRCVVSNEDKESVEKILTDLNTEVDYKEVIINSDIAKVSLVGAGMRSQAGVASKAFKALSENNVNIQIICTSEIKITMVIDEALVDKAVNVLHEEFELEK